MNRVDLIGRLTANPKSRTVGETTKTSFSIAFEHPAAKNGHADNGTSPKGHVSFFDVEVWGRQADVCAEHLTKGRRVAVSGSLRQERWKDDGKTRSRVSIRASSVKFLDRPRASGAEAVEEQTPAESPVEGE